MNSWKMFINHTGVISGYFPKSSSFKKKKKNTLRINLFNDFMIKNLNTLRQICGLPYMYFTHSNGLKITFSRIKLSS